MQRDIDVHRNQYQDIKVLGSEMTRDPKVSDKVRVVDTLANLNKNWESLEGLMQKRLVQSSNLFSLTKELYELFVNSRELF